MLFARLLDLLYGMKACILISSRYVHHLMWYSLDFDFSKLI